MQPSPNLLLIVIITGALFLLLLLLIIVIVLVRRRSTTRKQAVAPAMQPPLPQEQASWSSSYAPPAQPSWQPSAPSAFPAPSAAPSSFSGQSIRDTGADQPTSMAGMGGQTAGEETEAAGPTGFAGHAAPFGAPPLGGQPAASSTPPFGSYGEPARPSEPPASPFGQPPAMPAPTPSPFGQPPVMPAPAPTPTPVPAPSPFGPPPAPSPFGPPPGAKEDGDEVEKTVVRQRLPKLTFIGLLIDRKQPSRRYDVDKLNTTIGRSPGNSVALDDQTVSRQHASIKIEGNDFVLSDLGSSNGTFIGDERVSEPTTLRDGTLIRFGDVELTFKLVSLE